jgi:glycine/D-amino acid oxidase-like deaminating enzyme
VAVFERSEVVGIETHRNGVRVRTRDGDIRAGLVVIATGYATAWFRPLVSRFRFYRTYVLATAPLSALERRRIGFGHVMFWDTARPYHYARWTSDDRVLIGGGDRRIRPHQRQRDEFIHATGGLRDDMQQLIPGLRDARFTVAWEGLFAQTPDTLPYIGSHRRYPGHLFALGYGGNGMAFSYLASRLLCEAWGGRHPADLELFKFSRRSAA